MSGTPGFFGRALRLFRERALLYVSVAALPYFTVHLLLWWLLFSSPALRIVPGTSLREQMHNLSNSQLALFLFTLLLWATVPYALAGRGLCRVAALQIENREAAFGKIAVDMALFLPSALVLCLIVGAASMLGMGVFFIPALFIGALFTLVIPVGAIEKLGPFGSLKRGLGLAGGIYGRLLGLYFCFGLTIVGAFILQSVILSNLPHMLAARMTVVALVTCIPIVPLAIFNICLTLAYCEARLAGSPSAAPAGAI